MTARIRGKQGVDETPHSVASNLAAEVEEMEDDAPTTVVAAKSERSKRDTTANGGLPLHFSTSAGADANHTVHLSLMVGSDARKQQGDTHILARKAIDRLVAAVVDLEHRAAFNNDDAKR